MGRAGGGSSGGSHRSGGSHSSSRSSGSFRVDSSSSGSSRPRSRSSSSSSSSGGSSFNFGSLSSSGRGSYNNYGRTYNNYGGYNNYGSYGTGGFMGGSSRGIFSKILIIALVIMSLFIVFKGVSTLKSGNSTIVRNRLESGISYDNNVVLLDETGWITQKSKLGPNMRKFYDLTGVQPYIVMLEYSGEYATDKARESYADTLYDKYIDRDDALLFVYFGEEDIENDVGLMCYVLGHQAGSVFDEEAINIWYGNIDKYWYSDCSMEDVFVKSFNDTAKVIMSKPTTVWDTVKVLVLIAGVIVVLLVLFQMMKARNARAKEKAEETEKILKASMESVSSGSYADGDELVDKYKK